MKHTHKFLTVFIILALLLSATPAQPTQAEVGDGVFGWAKRIGGTDGEITYALTLDNAGNIYISGTFNGTVDFDPGAGTATLISAGEPDIFVCKLDKHGNFTWARRMGGTSNDQVSAIAVDSAGNVYTTGYFEGTADFDPGSGTAELTSLGGTDIFVSKLDSSGNYAWAGRMGGTDDDRANAIAVDSAGNVYTAGHFQGTADFKPDWGTVDLTSLGGTDIFVSKLDSGGDYVWAKSMGGPSGDQAYGLTLDSAGNVYTTGRFQGTVDFDPDDFFQLNLTSAGDNDIFVSRLNSSGESVWAKNMGGTSNELGYAITVDSAGNVFTTGYFDGTADFDPNFGTVDLVSVGGHDIFVSKLNSSGGYVWAKRMGGTSSDYPTAISLDSAGNVFTTGGFQDTADFDPGSGTANLTSAGLIDIFVSKLDSSGNYAWARHMGGTSNDYGRAIAVDSAGNVYTSGSFDLTADFDPGAGTASLTSAGGSDIFVSKLVNMNGLTLSSQAQYDGWVLESTETSKKGGTKNNRSKVFMVGDDTLNRQYRGFLSFDTSGLPDNAIVTKVTLKVKHAGLVGTNPYRSHRGLYVDIRKPFFGTKPTLQISDFQKGASLNLAGKFPKKPVSKLYTAVLSSAANPYVNTTGLTQFRLRYKRDDNNDFGADYLKLYSGNAPAASRPQLIVEYYLP